MYKYHGSRERNLFFDTYILYLLCSNIVMCVRSLIFFPLLTFFIIIALYAYRIYVYRLNSAYADTK